MGQTEAHWIPICVNVWRCRVTSRNLGVFDTILADIVAFGQMLFQYGALFV